MSNLLLKTTRGMLWSIAENLGLQLVQLVLSIALARLLLPEQFGLVGMLWLFMALAQSFLDSGFGSALIQKKDTTDVDTSSVFYFNLAAGAVLTLALYGAAPGIASFYNQPALTALTRFLALSVLINAWGLVPSALLTKEMDFKSLLKVSLIAVAASGILGIASAALGFGVWSLAIQSVSATVMRTILLWTWVPWRPSSLFSPDSLRVLFSFGSRLLLSGLVDTFFRNIYQPLIGKLFSAADLGYFVRAQSMQTAVVNTTGAALSRVMFPALSPMQDDRVKLKQVYRKTIATTAFFHFPLMLGLIVVAEPLITILLTERWSPSVPYFQLLCIVGLLYPLHVLNLNILKVVGRSDLFFRLEVAKKAMVVLSIALTYRWGVMGLLYGQVGTSVIGYSLNGRYSGQLIDYPMTHQIKDILPIFAMAALTGGTMYLVGTAIVDAGVLKLLVQLTTGIALYMGVSLLVRSTVLFEAVRFVRQVIRPQTVS